MISVRLTISFALSLLVLAGCGSLGIGRPTPRITHGVASGDVTAGSVVIWSRADREAVMVVRYGPASGEASPREASIRNSADDDFTAQLVLEDLEPNREYQYEVWFENAQGASPVDAGRFTTAPLPDQSASVSLIWGADLGGQAYCRRVEQGYPIFEAMREFQPDFFIAGGDMINADSKCPAQGPLDNWINVPGEFKSITDGSVEWENRKQVERVYSDHWLYNRADPAYQAFLRSAPIYAQWDDHEVINDFGAEWLWQPADPERVGYPNIVDAGRNLLLRYLPVEGFPDSTNRLYRSYRWGSELELFLIDTRSFRSENFLEDTAENAKTMLGEEQLEWLKDGLVNTTATWKVISGGIPLSVPTGMDAHAFGRDSWANGLGSGYAASTGFERELLELLSWIDQADIENVVFLSGDTHFPGQVRYEVDIDGDGDLLEFHEFISGPLSSSLKSPPPEFDPTLNPEILYSEGNIFNFGTIEIEQDSAILRTTIRDDNGGIRPGSILTLLPKHP